MFDKVDEFIEDNDKTKYLVLFGPEIYHVFYYRIRYLLCLNRTITFVYSYNYQKIKIDSDNGLSVEKTLTTHNLSYILNQFFIKVTTDINIKLFKKKIRIN